MTFDMDTISLVDVAFGIVTTLLLGALAGIEFFSDRRRRRADDAQAVLDIQSSLATSEIVGLLAQKRLDPVQKEFLKQTHLIAEARVVAIKGVAAVEESLITALTASVERVFSAISDDPEAQARQANIDARLGATVNRNDRSTFSWKGTGKLTKYELLHVIAQKFIADNGITTKKDFEEQFGAAVKSVISAPLTARHFTGKRLLDPINLTRHAKRDGDLIAAYGAITFDGQDYRAGWSLGYSQVRDLGRIIQLPVIDHFAAQPGYEIAPA